GRERPDRRWVRVENQRALNRARLVEEVQKVRDREARSPAGESWQEIVRFPSVWIDAYGRKRSNRAVRTSRTMLVALALLLAATAATFAANALIGTWKLNEGKSKFAPGATKNTTVTYAPAKGDMVKCTVG